MEVARETAEKVDDDVETMSTDSRGGIEQEEEEEEKEEGDDFDSDSHIDVVRIHFHGKQLTISGPKDMTIAQLASSVAELLSIAPEKQKMLITPKPGLLKFPFPNVSLASLNNNNGGRLVESTKITILGSTEKEISDLNATVTKVRRSGAGRSAPPKASRVRDWKKMQEERTYTFQTIRALTHLPNPERSVRFLERLADDPGIKAAMRKHRFSVGLLTEMDPAEHTTHQSRTLGLNRNRGEVVELRLRTDRYDGYRDYRVIRNTLCHELAHNRFDQHDRDFWDLTAQIENQVANADWKHGGHTLSHDQFYNPPPTPHHHQNSSSEHHHPDAGGWTGGDFVLGSHHHGSDPHQGLTRRDILATAALARAEKNKQQQQEQEQEQETKELQKEPTQGRGGGRGGGGGGGGGGGAVGA